jgi:hypothetical protein
MRLNIGANWSRESKLIPRAEIWGRAPIPNPIATASELRGVKLQIPRERLKLWAHYHCATATRAIIKTAFVLETGHTMASVPSTRDSLKSEKLSLLILAVCVVVLVSLVVFRPF